VRYTWNTEDPVDSEVGAADALWMVRRDQFDHFLVQQAQGQGAELWDETKATGVHLTGDVWEVATAQGPVRGRYLIAADGARGSLAKWLGFTQRHYVLGGALEAEPRLTMPEEPVIYFELGLLKNGYVWNFPKADGYSLGSGVFRVGSQRQQDLRAPLATYADLFGVQVKDVKQHGHPLNIWDGDQVLHTQRALLAGEAACVVDPFTAEGIRPSIFSGLKAAEAIDAALGGQVDALATYTQVMAQEWGTEMRWAKRLAQVFYQAPGLAYRLGVKRPSSTQKMAQLFAGRVSYAEVAQRAIHRLSGGWLGSPGT
jgi:geranylgeranyl reductase family protein